MTSGRIRVLVLGSTGSIGVQALRVIAAHPDRFELVGLAAAGTRGQLLARQRAETGVAAVAVADEAAAATIGGVGYRGAAGVLDLIADTGAEVVLNAMVGTAGLAPTLAALHGGARVALANKESLVVGGELVRAAAGPGRLTPVDSELAAIAQCLRVGAAADVARIVLTASGGPFRGWSRRRLAHATPAQAAAHPTWSMGPVNTLNSATLVNKGLELIETHLLFGVPYDRIEVVVHPQSIVHALVGFSDGAMVALASPPDMALPIAQALDPDRRVPGVAAPCDFSVAARWEFEPLDAAVFPAVELARRAGLGGGALPAIYHAANEVAAAAFTAGRLELPAICEVIAGVLDAADGWAAPPATVDEVFAAQRWARERAERAVVSAGSRKVTTAR